MDEKTQITDAEYVKQRVVAMQQAKIHGHVTAKLEDGVVQGVDILIKEWPPSKKKTKKYLTQHYDNQ